LPTKNFFYGMEVGEEIIVELDKGKMLLITLDSVGEPNKDGIVTVYFKINGQPRRVKVNDTSIIIDKVENTKIDKENDKHIGAPLQGLLSTILVKSGEKVVKNQALFIIEAMKMETTITALADTVVEEVVLDSGVMVNSEDLIVVLN